MCIRNIYVVFYVGLEMESLNMWIYMARAGFLIFEAALLTSLSVGKKYRIITSALHCHSHYKCFT